MAVKQIREHCLGRMQAPPKFCFAFRCHTCRPDVNIHTLERVAGLHQAKQGLVFGMKLAGGSVFCQSTLSLVLPITPSFLKWTPVKRPVTDLRGRLSRAA